MPVEFDDLEDGTIAAEDLGDEINSRLNALKTAVNIALQFRGTYSALTEYETYDLVLYNSQYWRALQTSTGQTPAETAYWTLFSGQVGLFQLQGNWNATTNSPTLTSSVGTSGDAYLVTTAGTTNLNGINDWAVNDIAWFGADGAWHKIDNTELLTGTGTTNKLALWSSSTGLTAITRLEYVGDILRWLDGSGNLVASLDTASGEFTSNDWFFSNRYSDTPSLGGAFIGHRARGTSSSPSAAQQHDRIVGLYGAGYGATEFNPVARDAAIIAFAAENFTDAARGTYWLVGTTPVTTSTRKYWWYFGNDGELRGLDGTGALTAVWNVLASGAAKFRSVTLPHITTPSAPAAGHDLIYVKSDDKLYKQTSGGVETEIGSGTEALDRILCIAGEVQVIADNVVYI